MKILSLVKLKNTGSPEKMASSLGISKATLVKDVKMINKIIESNLWEGVVTPIIYDKRTKTYKLREQKGRRRGYGSPSKE